MLNIFENIEEYRQHFDELQDIFKKGLSQLFSGIRKQVGR